MRLSTVAIIGTTFAAAAALCYVAAGFVVSGIEATSERSVRNALDDGELPWAEVQANGLQLILSGHAQTEALRFKALTTAGRVIDAARVIDQMTVKDAAALTPPRFSIEILRNDSGISLIGLVPAATDRAIPGGEVAVVVHRKGGDAVARFQAPFGKGLRQLARFQCDARPIGPFNLPIGPARQDFPRAMFARGIINQVRYPKFPILHASKHRHPHPFL